MLTDKILINRLVSVLTYEVPFLRHVTSKQYIFVMFSSKHQGNNRSVSRSNIKVKGRGKRSRSDVKVQGHVFSVIAGILILDNTLLIAHLSFESLGPIDCVLDLCHCQSTRLATQSVSPILQSMHSLSALSSVCLSVCLSVRNCTMYRPHHWLNFSEILTADVLSSKDPGKFFW